MTSSSQHAAGLSRRVATQGDLVLGLAPNAPPTPFVGALGDPAGGVARELTCRLLASAGIVVRRPPRVTVAGAELATLPMRAAPKGNPGPCAQPILGASLMRVAGEPVVRAGDPATLNAHPLVVADEVRTRVRLGGGATSAPSAAPTSGIAALRAHIPTRTEFGEPSPAHRILSRCSAARRPDLVPPELAVLVGDPVDVATGAVVTDWAEIDSASPPLRLRRRYSSARSDRAGAFGFGWAHDFEAALWLEPGRVVLREDDGREIEFDTLELPGAVARAGDLLHDATGRLALRSLGRLRWELREHGRVRHFGPASGEDPEAKDRGLARLARVARRGGGVIELHRDEHARLRELRVDDRPIVAFEHDDQGRIESLWRPLGTRLQRHARFEYSAEGDLVAAFDADDRSRRYVYSGHLLVVETDREGASFHYGYDAHGPAARCVRAWGDDGWLDRTFDYDGPHVRVTDALGHQTSYGIDPLGRVSAIVDPHGGRTRHRYDDHMRLVESVSPDGGRTRDTWDERGNLLSRRLPDGGAWRMTYDADDRLVQGWDPAGGEWRFRYDVAGRLTRIEDPLGHVTSIEYLGGRPSRIVDPEGGATELEVDSQGNVVTLAFPGEPPTRFAYDAWGRLRQALATSGARCRSRWSPHGRLLAHEDDHGTVELRRNAEGDVLAIETPTERWTIARDRVGRVRAVHGPDCALEYEHDPEGRLVTVRRDERLWLSLLRDARGLVEAFSRRGEPPAILHRTPGSGRIARIVDRGHTVETTWDQAGRLASVDHGDGRRASFHYREDGLLCEVDDAGDRLIFERDVRGTVIRQHGHRTTIEHGAVDWLGRRHGLDVGTALTVSLLRDRSGGLDRIVAAGRTVWDIAVTRTGDRRTEWLRSEIGELELRYDDKGRPTSAELRPRRGPPRQWSPAASCSTPLPEPAAWDALHRPRWSRLGKASIPPDEARTLHADGAWWLHHPDHGFPIARLGPERAELVLPDATAASLPTDDAADAAWHAAAFPLHELEALRSPARGPIERIAAAFRRRVWDPVPRPFAGKAPWSPDAWTAELEEVPAIDGHLDTPRLLRALAPAFPTEGLRPSPP